MRFFPALLAIISLFSSVHASEPTPPEKYEILIGQDMSGSGFVIRHESQLYAVASLHQFDNQQPEHFVDIEFKEIKVDAESAMKQIDVQALKLADQENAVPYLGYEPNFSISPGDAIIILGPAGELVTATVPKQELIDDEPYDSSYGPQSIHFITDKPFMAAGGSGCPVLMKSTGNVIGVFLSADDPKAAKRGTFETLCIGTVPKPTLASEIEKIAQILPHGNDWWEEGSKVDSVGLAWELLLEKSDFDAAKKCFVGGHFYIFTARMKLEFSNLTVMSFNDKQLVAALPDKLEKVVDLQVSLLNRDYEIGKVVVTNPSITNVDKSSLIRITGQDRNDRSAFNQTTLRVTRNTNFVEIVMRNGDLTDQQLFTTAESLLQAVEKFGLPSGQ